MGALLDLGKEIQYSVRTIASCSLTHPPNRSLPRAWLVQCLVFESWRKGREEWFAWLHTIDCVTKFCPSSALKAGCVCVCVEWNLACSV